MKAIPRSALLCATFAVLVAAGFLTVALAGSQDAEPSALRPGPESTDVKFYAVALDDETKLADKALRQYLQDEASLQLDYLQLSYEAVLDKLVEVDLPFVARATPYVFVVAEMLGARLEVLATYWSRATETTTYRSYFVVNRREFDSVLGALDVNLGSREPTLADLEFYLRARSDDSRAAKFIYHNRFSTSSFFVPSLFFRSKRVFAMESKQGRLVQIQSEKSGNGSSTNLVKEVASGGGLFAAVWDGTKAKFESGGKHFDEFGDRVLFIPQPGVI